MKSKVSEPPHSHGICTSLLWTTAAAAPRRPITTSAPLEQPPLTLQADIGPQNMVYTAPKPSRITVRAPGQAQRPSTLLDYMQHLLRAGLRIPQGKTDRQHHPLISTTAVRLKKAVGLLAEPLIIDTWRVPSVHNRSNKGTLPKASTNNYQSTLTSLHNDGKQNILLCSLITTASQELQRKHLSLAESLHPSINTTKPSHRILTF